MASFFTPGTTLSVRARRAIFESGNASTTTNRPLHRQYNQEDRTPDENMGCRRNTIQTHSTVRNPLSFISPNKIKTCFSSGGSNKENSKEFKGLSMKLWSGGEQHRNVEHIAHLKMEITDLQRQVQLLDETTSRKENVEVEGSEEKPKFVNEENETLTKLNDKLTEIQSGLLEIEDERENLFSKVKHLQRERAEIQNELSQREKEILSLSRRCAMQADKEKNSTLLLSMNKQLSLRIVDLQDEIHRNELENPNAEELKKKYKESLALRHHLENRLSDVTKDHQAMSEKLRSCIDTCERLTEEKRLWDNERRRIMEKASLEIEQQRFEHEKSIREYEADFDAKSKQVNELDRQLIERVSQIQKLQEELSFLAENQANAMIKITNEYECQIKDIEKDNIFEIDRMHKDSREQLARLESKITEKDKIICALRKDVATHMEDLMSTSSALNDHKESRKLLESLTEDVEMLEHERYSLSEELHQKETNIAELSAEILKLEIEKEFLVRDSQELQSLRIKLATSVDEKEVMRASFEKDLNETRLQGIALEKKIREMSESNTESMRKAHVEHSEGLSRMRAEIRGLEVKMEHQSNSHEDIVAANKIKVTSLEAEILNLAVEKEQLRTSYESELNDVRSASANFEKEVQRLTHLHASAICRVTSDHDKLVTSLRSKIDELEVVIQSQRQTWKSEIYAKETVISSLREKVLKLSDDLMHSNSASQSETSNLQREVQKMRAKLAIKDDEIRDLRVIELQEREETISSLRKEISQIKDVLEVKEKKSFAVIEDLERKAKLLEQKYANLQRKKTEDDKIGFLAGESLQRTISDIKRDLQFANISVQDLERKLCEANDAKSALQSKLQDLCANNSKLQSQLNDLQSENDTIKKHEEDLRRLLDIEIDRREFGDLPELKQKCEFLQCEISKAEKKIVFQQDQMAELEAIVQDRTDSLSTIVELNKLSETKLDESERRYNMLEEKASNLQVEVMDCDSKISLLRAELRTQADKYLDDLHEEQNRRELAESDLAVALSRLENCSIDKKELSELRKENQELKDKVHRQEAFMQRKLNKDKAQRDRAVGALPRYPTPVQRDATPTRSDRASKLMQPSWKGTSPGSRGIPSSEASQVTRSTVDETESLELDLDSLLAD